jgi:hypothetical protein
MQTQVLITIAILITIAMIIIINKNKGEEHHKPYDNLCISSGPLGHLTQVPAITYWKNQLSSAKKCQNKKSNEIFQSVEPVNLAKTIASGDIEADYYKNPVLYCMNNPGKRPCPNNWLVSK